MDVHFDRFRFVLPKLEYSISFDAKNSLYSTLRKAVETALDVTRSLSDGTSFTPNAALSKENLEFNIAVNGTCGAGCIDLTGDEELKLKVTLKCPSTSSEGCNIISPFLSLVDSNSFDIGMSSSHADFISAIFGREHHMSRRKSQKRSNADADGDEESSLDRKLMATSHNVTIPFTFDSSVLSNTDSARRGIESLFFEICDYGSFTLDACEGSVDDTYMRLFREDSYGGYYLVTRNDDFCGVRSLIQYTNYGGCESFRLDLGCYRLQTCSLRVRGYFGSPPSMAPTPSPTDPTIQPTLSPTLQADTPVTLPFTQHVVSSYGSPSSVNFTACWDQTITISGEIITLPQSCNGGLYVHVKILSMYDDVSYDYVYSMNLWQVGDSRSTYFTRYNQGCGVYRVQVTSYSCGNNAKVNVSLMGFEGTYAPTAAPTPVSIQSTLPFEHTTSRLENYYYWWLYGVDKESVFFSACQVCCSHFLYGS